MRATRHRDTTAKRPSAAHFAGTHFGIVWRARCVVYRPRPPQDRLPLAAYRIHHSRHESCAPLTTPAFDGGIRSIATVERPGPGLALNPKRHPRASDWPSRNVVVSHRSLSVHIILLRRRSSISSSKACCVSFGPLVTPVGSEQQDARRTAWQSRFAGHPAQSNSTTVLRMALPCCAGPRIALRHRGADR